MILGRGLQKEGFQGWVFSFLLVTFNFQPLPGEGVHEWATGTGRHRLTVGPGLGAHPTRIAVGPGGTTALLTLFGLAAATTAPMTLVSGQQGLGWGPGSHKNLLQGCSLLGWKGG